MTLWSDTGALFGRYLTKLVRNPTLLVTYLVTPVLFFALFSQMLGKLNVFPGVGSSYEAYLMPGMVVMCPFIFCPLAGISIVNDLNSGFLSKMLVTQVDRGAILLGRVLTDALMVVFASVLVIVTALVLGVSFANGPTGVLLILATAGGFGLVWAGIFLAIGMQTKSAESISAFSGGTAFLLLFLSSAVFPTSLMPEWAQTVANWNPVSYLSDAMRSAIHGPYDWHAFGIAWAWIAALALVAFAATLYEFRRTVR